MAILQSALYLDRFSKDPNNNLMKRAVLFFISLVGVSCATPQKTVTDEPETSCGSSNRIEQCIQDLRSYSSQEDLTGFMREYDKLCKVERVQCRRAQLAPGERDPFRSSMAGDGLFIFRKKDGTEQLFLIRRK